MLSCDEWMNEILNEQNEDNFRTMAIAFISLRARARIKLGKGSHWKARPVSIEQAREKRDEFLLPFPVLGSLAKFADEILLGLATATTLEEAVGEPAPEGLAAMSLCKMTGWEEPTSDDPDSLLLGVTEPLPWRSAGGLGTKLR